MFSVALKCFVREFECDFIFVTFVVGELTCD